MTSDEMTPEREAAIWKDVAQHNYDAAIRAESRATAHEQTIAELREALREIDRWSNGHLGVARPYGDEVFALVRQPGEMARAALAAASAGSPDDDRSPQTVAP